MCRAGPPSGQLTALLLLAIQDEARTDLNSVVVFTGQFLVLSEC